MSHSRLIAWTLIVAALFAVPAPLLPPHRFAELLQSILKISWPAAYLMSAVALQGMFYCSLGALAGCSEKRQVTWGFRLLQVTIVTAALLCSALIIRSLKAGHPAVWANVVVAAVACVVGVLIGVGFLYRQMKTTVILLTLIALATLWGLSGGSSATLKRSIESQLAGFVAAAPTLPAGDDRFGALLRIAFARGTSNDATDIRYNRAAIAALGICVGHPALARLAGLDPASHLVDQAERACAGTTLQGREDWARHYTLSAALAVLDDPLVSEAGGLMKEQLDALTEGSGFSFGDLAADRAGVRFAISATKSETSAKSMQQRLAAGFVADDFFPPMAQFAENMSLAEFRATYGGVGTKQYWSQIHRIDAQLDTCPALVVH